MEDNKKTENQEILVDGKTITEQSKKTNVFQKIGNGIKAGGRFVWKHKEALVGIAAGFGLKMALDWAKGGVAIDEDSDEEIDDDSTED